MQILTFLQTRSRLFIFVLSAALIFIIGGTDYVTGSEISFSIFYLTPIAIAAWYAGSRAGILASVGSAIVWLLVDRTSGRVYSSAAIPFWNAGVRLGFFLIVTYTLASLRAARARQDALAQFLVHDLRSPLSNVLAGLQYLGEIANDKLDAGELDLVRLSIASGSRMLHMIEALLDLAALENGSLKPDLQTTTVSDLFDTTIQQISVLAMQTNRQVANQIDTGGESVLADAGLTVRVLVNLVSNALKYAPRDSVVTLRAAPDQNGSVIISITDQGMGIPKEWLNKVFDKFVQVDARSTGVRVGTGLGLTFCQLAVLAQGGRIWIESEENRGTTVYFSLPAVKRV